MAELFRQGQDIDGFLSDCAGYNVLRVFDYTPVADWKREAWDRCPSDVWLRFLEHVGASGFFVELVLLTDDDPARVGQARQLLRDLAAAKPRNLFIEIANEPSVHKSITTAALRADANASGFLFASGDYEDSRKWFGNYGTAHTARSTDWVRRAHDFVEYYGGGGPNDPGEPACKAPWVADEPAKPEDVGGDKVRDFYAYAAACSLLAAGATFHSTSGKFCTRFNAEERTLAKAFLDGLNLFPADAPAGSYRRIPENPNPPEGRTYVIGERFMVRCQQPGTRAPEPGWTALDSMGVAFKR